MNSIYHMVKEFKYKFPGTIAWRLSSHCQVLEKHVNPDEKVIYAFACQKNNFSYEIFSTYAVAITDKRIILAQKRLLFGYIFLSITPELYNDLSIYDGLIWGKLCIDTVKEVIQLSNLSKSCLDEVETKISTFMMEAKKDYMKQA